MVAVCLSILQGGKILHLSGMEKKINFAFVIVMRGESKLCAVKRGGGQLLGIKQSSLLPGQLQCVAL